jgi:hypothetical protein
MAHYALIDENNIVIHVITGVDEDIIQTDLDGTIVGGSSEAWEQFYASRPWFQGLTCKRTSYSNRIRKQYAGIGFTYDSNADIFIAPQPYPSWLLNENYDWNSPVPYPTDDKSYAWDEESLSWIEFEIPAP